ncbi:hypothetical protein H0H87_001430 [Tephrocybe sp. NHM501043]|nr:hypothetical protein H0H87_001430 [Tephrocybe sp. NHM501043]
MPSNWEPGTDYATGAVVIFEGKLNMESSISLLLSDWTPSATPALWGRIPNQWAGDHQQQPIHHEPAHHQTPTGQSPPTYQQHHDDGAQLQQGHHYEADHKPEPTHTEPEKKHWYDDKGKLGLAIGGGITASLLAGGIHHIVKKHGEKEDEIGAASAALEKGAVFGYKHKEHHVCVFPLMIVLPDFTDAYTYQRDVYEILLGDMRGLRWVRAHGKVNASGLGHPPVEGGHEHDGTPLYIIRAVYGRGYYPGKASATLDGAYIPIDGTEKNIKEYEVLCYNS